MKLRSPLELAFYQLASLDTSIRKLGAQAICAMMPREEVAAIREAFKLEQNPGVAKWLALTLGKMGDKGSLAALQHRLKALGDGDLRHWVLVAINMIRFFATNREIIQQLESNDPATQKEGLILSWRNPRVDERATAGQRRLLDSDDPSVRRWALLSYGSAKDFTVDAAVIAHLDDPDYLALEWAEHVITGKVPVETLPTLEANLSHSEPRVREWAIKALASTGRDGVFARLMQHYRGEEDPFCKDAVIRSLATLDGTPEVNEFLRSCARAETHPVAVSALIDATVVNSHLRADDKYLAILANKECVARDPTLQIGLARVYSAHLSPKDVALVEGMTESAEAQRAWEFLSTLPFSRSENGQESFRSRRRRGQQMIPIDDECDVVVLIAKKEEFRAFMPLIGKYDTGDDLETGKSTYSFDLQRTSGRPVRVAALCLGGMGNERTVFWAQKLNQEMRPSILVNIGIAAGIHDDIVLGDVVVANQVENYLADAKAQSTKSGKQFEFSLAGDPYKTDANLVNRAQNMEFASASAFQAWEVECEAALADIPAEKLKNLLRDNLIRQKPHVEEGHVASGTTVAAAEPFVTWLKTSSDRTYIAIEMESAGGALALYESATGTRHLVIRGISDFGDTRKKDLDNIGGGGVRKLAMQNATRFLFALLRLLPDASLTRLGGEPQ